MRAASTALLLAGLTGCAWMPSEPNLSPFYRHRLERDGTVREIDVLWPVFHFERTPDGGPDFRIRPFYRYVAAPAATPEDGDAAAPRESEHQFLWPIGRVHHSAQGETLARVFPFWWYKARDNDLGLRETDWNSLYLVWGGTREDGEEDYFAVLPFYADIPDFLTYDRFQTHLFPLHVALEKGGMKSHIWLWPLFGYGSDAESEDSTGREWHRALPLYAVAREQDRFERYSALWPFVHWGHENLDTSHPVERFFLFPFYGRMTGDRVDSWTFLWPFFSKMELEDTHYRVDVLWPIFRYHEDRLQDNLRSRWFWPLWGETETDDQRSVSFLWPLGWMREYHDPEGVRNEDWLVPFFWHARRRWHDGTRDSFSQVWPLARAERNRDGSGSWSVPSPWPYRSGNAYGVAEAYDWLWTLAKGRYSKDSEAFQLTAHLFTTAEQDGRRQTSVPFLFNYESDETDGSQTLRLFQFLPIWWSSAADDEAAR